MFDCVVLGVTVAVACVVGVSKGKLLPLIVKSIDASSVVPLNLKSGMILLIIIKRSPSAISSS